MRRGLEHHRAAGGQRRASLAGDHRSREVPGRDGSRHTNRLLLHQNALVRLMTGDNVTVDSLGFFAKPLQEGRCIGNLATCFGQRLALLCGHDAGQVFLVLHHQLKPLAQYLGALLGSALTPLLLGNTRRFDGTTGFVCAHVRHTAEAFMGSRIGDVGARALIGLAPVTGDKGLLAKQVGAVQLHRRIL